MTITLDTEDMNFYPRPPRGGRPGCRHHRRGAGVFLSTPSARRATRCGCCESNGRYISIHALREEGDSFWMMRGMLHLLFLSTPSARRATDCNRRRWRGWLDFYPRPPRGGRRGGCLLCGCTMEFLSTPSARRATAYRSTERISQTRFLSTPSARRATYYHSEQQAYQGISIHALREEGDSAVQILDAALNISIHALREEGDGRYHDLPSASN